MRAPLGMNKDISVGDKVSWAWGAHTARGSVKEQFTKRVSRTVDGTRVTRRATTYKPAFLIEQENGSRVLKSTTELHRK